MCLSHLSWINAFNDTVESTYTEENATETGKHVRERLSARPRDVAGAPHPNLSGKGECEDTRCVCRTSPGSLPSFQHRCRGAWVC